MLKKPCIIGNWKMHLDLQSAVQLIKDIKQKISNIKGDYSIAIAPNFLCLGPVKNELQNSKIKLAAQNCFFEPQGAFTGEISASMLRDLGCDLCIIGHSERRNIFLESDDLIAKKVLASVENNIIAILCVGETLPQRQTGKYFEIIEKQLTFGLKNLNNQQMQKIIIAYEPVWAIGTGKAATTEDAEEVHLFIRNYLIRRLKVKMANDVLLLYGGSVKPDNAKSLYSQKNVDGFLVGGASLKVDDFARIIASTST